MRILATAQGAVGKGALTPVKCTVSGMIECYSTPSAGFTCNYSGKSIPPTLDPAVTNAYITAVARNPYANATNMTTYLGRGASPAWV